MNTRYSADSNRPCLWQLCLMLLILLPLPSTGMEPLTAIGDEAFAVMTRWLDYKPAASQVRIDELRDTANGRLHKIVFTGQGGGRVPGYLEFPLHGEAPYPCIILIHGMARSKELWWSFGTTTEGKHKDRLVAEGFAILGLDLPLHGERAAENDFANPAILLQDSTRTGLRDLFTRSVIDHRRAIDALWTRADIDTSRIGVLGYGFGGSVAMALAAVDPRIQATITCVPPTERDRLAVHATQNYAPRIRGPLLMLMATNSRTSSPEDAEELHTLFPGDKAELKVYTSDDRLPIWYVGDAVSWFSTQLAP